MTPDIPQQPILDATTEDVMFLQGCLRLQRKELSDFQVNNNHIPMKDAYEKLHRLENMCIDTIIKNKSKQNA